MKIAGSELSAELKHLTAEKARLSRFVEQANQERTEIERLRETANRELNEGQDALKIVQRSLLISVKKLNIQREQDKLPTRTETRHRHLKNVTTKVSAEERWGSLKQHGRLKRQEQEVVSVVKN